MDCPHEEGEDEMRLSAGNLPLGPGVVEVLLPHRRPFLMVDRVERFSMEPNPAIEAGRHISMNEVFFQGHFPEMPIWPGALTMEGLAQSAALLLALVTLHRGAQARGEDPAVVMEALRNLDRGYRLHPGYRPERTPELLERLAVSRDSLALGAAVDLKFLKPVFPGCRMDYAVELTDDLGSLVRFSAEATVDGEPVARGTITGAVTEAPVPPRRA